MAVATVVVPTVGRDRSLSALLRALAAEPTTGPTAVPWELVVVNSGSATTLGPGAREALEACSRAGIPHRVEREVVPGASAARNRGIAAARGEVIVFFDDDAIPQPGCLGALIGPISAGIADGTGGEVRLDPDVARPRWLTQETAAYLSAYRRGDAEIDLPPDDYVLTANAAFRTELLRSVGGFDLALGPRPGAHVTNDDVDLCRKIVAAGGRLRYVPAAVVVHDLPPSRLRIRYLVSRAYQQGRSDWLLDRDHFERIRGRALRQELHRLRGRLGHRLKVDPRTTSTAMSALCDLARSAGFTREAASGRGAPTSG